MSLTIESQNQIHSRSEELNQESLPNQFQSRTRSEEDNYGKEESKKRRLNVIRKGVKGTYMDYDKKPVLGKDDYPGEIVWLDIDEADEDSVYNLTPDDKWIYEKERNYREFIKSKEEAEKKTAKYVEEKDGGVKYGVWLLLLRDAPYCYHCKTEGNHGTRKCPEIYAEFRS
ncbi:hypothetical protein ACHQM5_017015 [Ranunculus cassubicifolius]